MAQQTDEKGRLMTYWGGKQNKQQTAVNFLYEFVQLKLTHEQQMQFEGLFQQAKQMEKKQIMETYLQGTLNDVHNQSNAEQYYNETYGGQGNPDTTTSLNTQNK